MQLDQRPPSERPYMSNGLYLDSCHGEPHWSVPLVWLGVVAVTAVAWIAAVLIVIEMFKRWHWWP